MAVYSNLAHRGAFVFTNDNYRLITNVGEEWFLLTVQWWWLTYSHLFNWRIVFHCRGMLINHIALKQCTVLGIFHESLSLFYCLHACSFKFFNYYDSQFTVDTYYFADGRCLCKQPQSVIIGISMTKKFQKSVGPSVCLSVCPFVAPTKKIFLDREY